MRDVGFWSAVVTSGMYREKLIGQVDGAWVVQVVAVGECGCNGGVFGESYASCGAVANVIPVDVAVPGCPPAPLAILQGILTAVSVKAETASTK